MDANQFNDLIVHIDGIGAMVGGFLLTLVVAVTWKG